jgi:Uma2 family endonuclease
MSALQKKIYLSEESYLAFEEESESKHEYVEGEIYAMAGAGTNHNRITATLTRHFGNHLDGKPCEVFASDMKLKVQHDFFYPDVMVVCNQSEIANGYTEDALIIVEVLSKSTRQMDQKIKRLRYQGLPSLQEYVLIEPEFVDVEICRRKNHWQSEHFYLGDDVYFSSMDLTLTVEQLYARVINEDTAIGSNSNGGYNCSQ